MAIGKGRYDDELTRACAAVGAAAGVLIVMDGDEGPGFSVQATLEQMRQLPGVLRELAAIVEQDMSRDVDELERAGSIRGTAPDPANRAARRAKRAQRKAN